MSSKGKNIGIAQPRQRAPRPNLLKTAKARFKFPNSIVNSHYQHSLFGTPSSNNRKLQIYHKQQNNKHKKQFNLEARVGQMDRLNRIKAAAMARSSGKMFQIQPQQQPPQQQPPQQEEGDVGDQIDAEDPVEDPVEDNGEYNDDDNNEYNDDDY